MENEGYWSDSTISNDFTASWRVLIQLRLYCHDLSEGGKSVEEWRRVVSGEEEIISVENEERVEECIKSVAKEIRRECAEGIELFAKIDDDMEEGFKLSRAMLEGIWREELRTLNGIINS